MKKGWLTEEYFPIQISKTFFEYCLFNRTYSSTLNDFLQFITEEENEMCTEAIKDFYSIDKNDLLDFLGKYDCRSVVNSENFKKILDEIAMQEVIQKPAFIRNCWGNILKDIITSDKLHFMYKSCKPTSRNINNALLFEENLSDKEQKVSQYLRDFIKESDEKTRMLFLRFCTGSNILAPNKIIKVSINPGITGIMRCPTAHTCSCTLEITDTYENYFEFRSEFASVLNSKIWVMDYI